MRITAQLIDALTGHHLFSERYDRELKDILNLQDEITLKVLTAVRVKLTTGERARIFEGGTKNLDAYLKVLEASEIKAGEVNKGDLQRSMQLCEEAIALDPEYAHAYATLSTAHSRKVLIGASDSPKESLRLAVEIGQKAIALDESRSGILVWPYALNREFDKAIEAAEKAVSHSPNSAAGYLRLGAALALAGRHGVPPTQHVPDLDRNRIVPGPTAPPPQVRITRCGNGVQLLSGPRGRPGRQCPPATGLESLTPGHR